MFKKKPAATVVKDPLVMVFRTESGEVITHLHPGEFTHQHYGILVCDLVRHIARAFKVDESAVWDVVEVERRNPTSDVTNPS